MPKTKTPLEFPVYILTVRATGHILDTFFLTGTEKWQDIQDQITTILRTDHERYIFNANYQNPTFEISNLSDAPDDFATLSIRDLPTPKFPFSELGCQIIDAFMCRGTRFELDTQPCLVKVYRETFRFWAEVSFAIRPSIPVTVIDIKRVDLLFPQEFVAIKLSNQVLSDKKYQDLHKNE